MSGVQEIAELKRMLERNAIEWPEFIRPLDMSFRCDGELVARLRDGKVCRGMYPLGENDLSVIDDVISPPKTDWQTTTTTTAAATMTADDVKDAIRKWREEVFLDREKFAEVRRELREMAQREGVQPLLETVQEIKRRKACLMDRRMDRRLIPHGAYALFTSLEWAERELEAIAEEEAG